MAEIAPFRAWRYDSSRFDLGQLVTQPYDKITPAMQEQYYQASPHNLVRIILGKQQTDDDPQKNTYTRAAAFFKDWRQQGILRQDSKPALYRYIQRFTNPLSGAELERHSFIALGKIEDYSAEVVFRHEHTLSKPKADRLSLLRAARAHFGQIFMLYDDGAVEIDDLLAKAGQDEMVVADEYGVEHRLSVVSDSGTIEVVRSRMAGKTLIIADGHHRYETALNYRNEARAAHAADAVPSGQFAPYDYVMMTFVNMNSPGLVILPTHRVVHGLPHFSVEDFRERARTYFSVDEADSTMNARRATGLLKAAGQAGTAMLAVTRDRVFLIDTPRGVSFYRLAGLSVQQQNLDIVQLHRCLLEDALGISEEAILNQQHVSYIRDADEAMSQVRSGNADIAFLMNPVRMSKVRDIAFAGDVLPQKSTDFYPKMLSGLTIYALD